MPHYTYIYDQQVAEATPTIGDPRDTIRLRLPERVTLESETVEFTTVIDIRIYMKDNQIRVSNRRVGFMDTAFPGFGDLPDELREAIAHFLAYQLALSLEKLALEAEQNTLNPLGVAEPDAGVTLGEILAYNGMFSPELLVQEIEAFFTSPSTQSLSHEDIEAAVAALTDLPYINIPSPFDINFTGPTRVHVWSQIDNLLFTPSAINFRSARDIIYYRNKVVSPELSLLRFDNAYNDASSDPAPFNTPYNQQHKIDFDMVMPQEGKSLRGNYTWLLTPMKIDPPWGNGGGGVPNP